MLPRDEFGARHGANGTTSEALQYLDSGDDASGPPRTPPPRTPARTLAPNLAPNLVISPSLLGPPSFLGSAEAPPDSLVVGEVNVEFRQGTFGFRQGTIGELQKWRAGAGAGVLDKLAQLEAVEPISGLRPADLEKPREPLGRFHRGGETLYRLRSGDHRFYFDIQANTLFVRYILHRNSLEDFLLRNKLPVTETQLVEQHSKFWKYLESLTKKAG